MAIGDVQIRFDTGNQLTQAGGNTDQNRPQVRLPEPQDNRINTFSGNQLGVNNENAALAQDSEPVQTDQNSAPDQAVRLNRPDILELNAPPQGAQNNEPDVAVSVATENANSGGRSDDAILLSTNNNAGETAFAPARTDNQDNTVNQATERTANDQISNIENTNAAVAATPPRQIAAANALTQENQVGSRIDTTA